ncbi:MAG: dynamin family protein [Phaeodactylibacter sp.]|nr:dynamin family protein [Phaeodactylibacter sp.]MCB9050226.1 dynamin family protein [Lewinellaceae bacterium]
MSKLINQNIQALRAQVDEIIKDLHELTIRIGNEELAQTVSDLRNRIHEPFMFVIVGEVKAGKSSFINALLDTGREIAKVAPQPMTDTIQQILYGEQEEFITINPFLKKVMLPIEILKEIAIVDTPGTNTIIENHQQVTESFIPASDLIVFVFEAKNPYRQSAWQFFDFIHADWRKKVIFVLQQKDLMPPEDLEVNMNGVREYAEKKGISHPLLFAVSAKQEQNGQKEESGFGPVRQYIQDNITGGKAPILKLRNNIETSLNIHERIEKGLELRKAQYKADVEFRQDIHETLEKQEIKSLKQVDVMVENLLAGYDRITRKKGDELSEGLSFFSLLKRTFSSMFSKKASAKDWLENLAKEMGTELNEELKAKLNSGVVDLADSIQQMAKIIDLKIRSSQTILRDDHELFSDIAEKRNNVLRELQEQFSRFVNRTENFTDESLFPDKSTISPTVATGSGLAVIGLVLAAVAQGMVFDITGGILTTIGLLFAGISSRVKRRKILEGFSTEVAKGRTRMEEEVSTNLKAYITNLKGRIESNFVKFDLLLEKEQDQITRLEEMHRSITERLNEIKSSLMSESESAEQEERGNSSSKK